MRFGFVPYRNDVGLFCSVDESGEPVRPGEGASVQFGLDSPLGLATRKRALVLAHDGRVTLGRGAISRRDLTSLIGEVAREAAVRLGEVDLASWPIEIGATDDVSLLIDRLFLYVFAIEQAKRRLSQNRTSSARRSVRIKELLPTLDSSEEESAIPFVSNAQGYGVSYEERKAVERYAEQWACDYFVGAGYTVRRVGKLYDLECTGKSPNLRVEVKGTTGLGDAIEVTIGEINHARSFGRVTLFVVSEIRIEQGRPCGGRAWLLEHWRVDDAALIPLRFRYAVERSSGRFVSR